jgi:hypothetical protein
MAAVAMETTKKHEKFRVLSLPSNPLLKIRIPLTYLFTNIS